MLPGRYRHENSGNRDEGTQGCEEPGVPTRERRTTDPLEETDIAELAHRSRGEGCRQTPHCHTDHGNRKHSRYHPCARKHDGRRTSYRSATIPLV